MFTIFTVPKAFIDTTQVIQENAISSWKALHPDIEIVLFGDEKGIAEAAEKYGCIHYDDIEKNQYGTPLLNSIFQSVQKLAHHEIVCYVNADILLLQDSIQALHLVNEWREFLLIGRRTNINLSERIKVEDPAWEERIRDIIHNSKQLGSPDQIDCFIFPKNLKVDMPPFAVGRAGWDNWLISNMKKRKVPVIDASGMITIVHQNHGYHHVPLQRGTAWEGPETDINRKLMGGFKNLYTIDDADFVMTKEGIIKKRDLFRGFYRNIIRYCSYLLQSLHPLEKCQ